MTQLDEIDRAQPECVAWTERQRALARRFDLDALSRSLAESGEHSESAHR